MSAFCDGAQSSRLPAVDRKYDHLGHLDMAWLGKREQDRTSNILRIKSDLKLIKVTLFLGAIASLE